MKHNGGRHVLKFYVVENNCQPLLSAETCEEMDLLRLNTPISNSVHQFECITVQQPSPKKLWGTNTDKVVFHGLGHVGDVSIVVDKAVQPAQHSPRRVPVAL